MARQMQKNNRKLGICEHLLFQEVYDSRCLFWPSLVGDVWVINTKFPSSDRAIERIFLHSHAFFKKAIRNGYRSMNGAWRHNQGITPRQGDDI